MQTPDRRLYQAAPWRRSLRFVIVVFLAIWVWATLDSESISQGGWSALLIGFVIAVAIDVRGSRMGLEWTGQEFVLHRFWSRKRLEPDRITQFKVEPVPGRFNNPDYPALVIYTDTGRVRAGALEFVRPGWRQKVLGPQRLTWRGGSTTAIEEALNAYLKPAT